jgi:hypothetical protein
LAPQLYLLLLLVFFPVCVYLPTHLLLQKFFQRRGCHGERVGIARKQHAI